MSSHVSQPQSSELLASKLVDYAGLFPPAELPMVPMLDEWVRALASRHSSMLGRLILPLDRLDEFARARAALHADAGRAPRTGPPSQASSTKGTSDKEGPEEATSAHGDPWRLSVVVGRTSKALLPPQIERILSFNEAYCATAVIDVAELKVETSREIETTLELLPDGLFPYFEVPVAAGPTLPRNTRELIETLGAACAAAKVRTGGVFPELHPTPNALAEFLSACSDSRVAFKASAGTHLAWRNYNPTVKAMQFGFLNIFLAALVAWRRHVPTEVLVQILSLETASAVSFGGDNLAIDDPGINDLASNNLAKADYVFDLEEIREARLNFAHSFGCCSFDDPVASLASSVGTPEQ